MIFMGFMAAACVVLFLQRLTGMGVHAVLGLAVLVLSIRHTIKYRKIWKTRTKAQKIWEIIMWAGLAVSILTGFLLKPFAESIAVLLIHKLSAVIFVLGLLVHIKEHLHRFKRRKK